ncbi:hypothetical protein FO519_004550 [Halicephalobus sp. NKZ332]|nr:hypothetical protein FO519_004550 [Halicephalobus sp. NKZ332]
MSYYQKTGAAASGNDHRKKWDLNEYAAKANERLAEERATLEAKNSKGKPKGPKVKRELLQAREEKVGLESKIGKQVTINKTTAIEDSGGFYCDVCECNLKDSVSYLDHINGKNHQKKLGFSMKVKKSTVDDVVNRFAQKKAELFSKKNQESSSNDYEEAIREEAAKMADLRRQKQEVAARKRPKESELDDEGEDEMSKLMGFGGFGSSKKPR